MPGGAFWYRAECTEKGGIADRPISQRGGALQVKRIAVIGDLVLDVVAQGARTPDTDSLGQVAAFPGGSAANFAVWAARLGRPVRFAGRVGADMIGRALVADLQAEGVEAHVAQDASRPTTCILVWSDGRQRDMIVGEGATHFQQGLPDGFLADCGWLHLTGYSFFWPGPEQVARQALAVAQEAGVPVSLDPSSAGLLRDRGGMEVPATLLLPNYEEGALLTGHSDPLVIARSLSRDFPLVGLKLGANGAVVASWRGAHYVAPADHGAAVDPTGAGDSWDATVVAHLEDLELESLLAAAVKANDLAARVVTRAGARPRV